MATATGRGVNIYDYPVGIGTAGTGITGQPYMLLTSYESKNAIESVGQAGTNPGIAISSIALYIPPNGLKTDFTADWGGLKGAAITAGMGGAAAKLMGAEDMASALFKGAVSAGTVVAGKIAGASESGAGVLAAQGLAVNNHMALTYKGPGDFRTHEFAFNFFPKSKQDAEAIKNILKDLQNGTLPRMAGPPVHEARTVSAPFFMAPRHWEIDFFNGDGTPNTFLHTIKKSVIKSMSVNHDPNSTISFHADGSPVQTTLTLTFQEIELQYSGDTLSVERNQDYDTQLSAQRNTASSTVG